MHTILKDTIFYKRKEKKSHKICNFKKRKDDYKGFKMSSDRSNHEHEGVLNQSTRSL